MCLNAVGCFKSLYSQKLWYNNNSTVRSMRANRAGHTHKQTQILPAIFVYLAQVGDKHVASSTMLGYTRPLSHDNATRS